MLLLLHGIGSNEQDLYALAPYLDPRLLIICARAPLTLGPGAYGWFELSFTPQGMQANLEQAQRSLELLPRFVQELAATYRIDASRTFVGGFSQGAMMSLGLALTSPELIAGVVAMSGRLPAPLIDQMKSPEALRKLPMLVTHGLYDQVLPIEDGRAARRTLESLGVKVDYREYAMGHEVSEESLADVTAWLSAIVDKSVGENESGA